MTADTGGDHEDDFGCRRFGDAHHWLRPTRRQAQTPIKVSYQPALYWALPFYIATEKNWWKEVGLDAELLDLPRRRAADRGGAGEVVGRRWQRLGAGRARRGCASAFSPSASPTTNRKPMCCMVRGDKFDGFKTNPQSLKGQKILLTANSTGDYAVATA